LRWAWLALAATLLIVGAIALAARRQATPTSSTSLGRPGMAVVTPGTNGGPTPGESCGPHGRVDGVPLGWAPSQAGAVGAAAAYAKTMSTLWFLSDRDRRHAALHRMAVPREVEGLIASQDRLADELDLALGAGRGDQGRHAALITALLGYRVDQFADTKARVALWAVVMHASDVGGSMAPAWSTSTLDLEWIGGDWKLAKAITTAGPGPVSQPADGLVDAPPDLIAAARSFREFSDVPA
jgi:hypothetical protein